MDKINVTAVSYLNTKPFLFGLIAKNWDSNLNIELDIPAACAQKLIEGSADIGLVPVATLLQQSNLNVISDYCIGSDGPVRTVSLFAEKPVEELKRIYLDFHSKTSVELLKVLLRDYWKLSPELIPASPGFIDQIGGDTGALVIGDRAISLNQRFEYIYDLSEEWKNWKGLPFVFAVWVSRIDLTDQFLTTFNEALSKGVDEIDRLIYLMPPTQAGFDLKTYFTKYISYELDDAKKQALHTFLQAVHGDSIEVKYLNA